MEPAPADLAAGAGAGAAAGAATGAAATGAATGATPPANSSTETSYDRYILLLLSLNTSDRTCHKLIFAWIRCICILSC